MGKLPRITGKEMLEFLLRQCFKADHTRGSHHYLRRENLRTNVPVHGNKMLKIGTLRSILRDIRLSSIEFEELWRKR